VLLRNIIKDSKKLEELTEEQLLKINSILKEDYHDPKKQLMLNQLQQRSELGKYNSLYNHPNVPKYMKPVEKGSQNAIQTAQADVTP
jgi:hypothetical protein